MKRKLLAALLASGMILSLAACGNSATTTPATSSETETPAAETTESEASAENLKDEITVICNATLLTEGNYLQEFAEQLSDFVGVKFTIQPQDHSGYNDAVGRIFVSGADWDVMVMPSEMYYTYANTGVFKDMTEMYENSTFYSKLNFNPNSSLYIDGHLYGISGTRGNGCITYIRKAWLDAVGMDIPTTYDEFIALCDAFVNQDPDGDGVDDTFAISSPGFMGTGAPFVHYLPQFYQGAYPDIMQLEDGTWVDGFTQQNFRDALQRIQDGVLAGYLDVEAISQGTSDARKKFYDEQSGIFTYWAGTWAWDLTQNLNNNGLDGELVVCPPIEESPGYIDRNPSSWVMNANLSDEEAQFVFDKFFEPMFDQGYGQTLWTYGAKGYNWDDKAETVTWGENSATYEEGQFHMLPNGETPDTLTSYNHLDPTISAIDIIEGPALTKEQSEGDAVIEYSNDLFGENCYPCPVPPTTDLYASYKGDISTARYQVIAAIAVEGMDVETAYKTLYEDVVGAQVEEILAELNN